MHNGLDARMARLFNRQGDSRAVCVAADHGYMSDVTPNVVKLKSITEAVIRGGVDGILMSPGQAMRLAPLFQGRDGPALIVRADWMLAIDSQLDQFDDILIVCSYQVKDQ